MVRWAILALACGTALAALPITHLQVLQELQSSDSVLPPKLGTHPLNAVYNREAVVPAMCYTRTDQRFNPCYVCHQNSLADRENTMNDGDLQEAYSFSELGMTNHWTNLFEDRSARADAIDDAAIRDWIDDDNYSELPGRLRAAGFQGWSPDLANLQEAAGAFDSQGIALDGSHWVAFNYKPFPSTFWPTNGSIDDVMIRLPEPYRLTSRGKYSRALYLANLSIVELNIKGLAELSLPALDEREVGADLDDDGKLGVAQRLTPRTAFVGAARKHVFLPGQYPMGTEFLHTVRYLGIEANGAIAAARRMKEVRYMKKWQAVNRPALAESYREEGYNKDMGLLPAYANLRDHGLDNGMGWSVSGFIENRQGRLRVSTYEENLYCMGCHSSVGTTIDKTFAFPRKVDGAEGWGYINLRGMPDAPSAGEQRGEIATYLERVGSGDEFRSNQEMIARWVEGKDTARGSDAATAPDVYELVMPSASRAMQLNKAYRVLVEDQDYIFGRETLLAPPANVYARVENDTADALPADAIHTWDIRLDWRAASRTPSAAKVESQSN